MVKQANEADGSFAFQHTTTQEYLAAQELVRRISEGEVHPKGLGFNPSLFNVFTFAFGHSTVPGQNELWSWLKFCCTEPDRFGIVFIKAAQWLNEAGERDGGLLSVGRDIREPLWELFVRSAAPRRYAEALITLSADWTIQFALQDLKPHRPGSLVRLALLVDLIPSEHPGRRELAQRAMQARPEKSPTLIELHDTQELSDLLARDPMEAANLTLAESSRTESELIAEARKERDPIRLRQLLMRIAMFRNINGEQFLVQQLKNSQDQEKWSDVVEALGTLGTVGAREALLDAVESLRSDVGRLHLVLKSLARLPIDRHAERILALMGKEFPTVIRVTAATVLGNTENSKVLNSLADFASLLHEPDWEVRRSVIASLARAKYVSLVRTLWLEHSQGTTRNDDEREVCILYLGAIARHITTTRDYAGYFSNVENLFLKQITNIPAPIAALRLASQLSRSGKIAEALTTVARDESRSDGERAAAITSLHSMSASLPADELIGLLTDAASRPEYREIATACAGVLAHVAPARLLGRTDSYSEQALWRLSLETDTLVYVDRIVSPNRSISHEDEPRPTKKKKRGPESKYDKADDARLYKDWTAVRAQFRTIENFALARRLDPESVKLAIDRARPRRSDRHKRR